MKFSSPLLSQISSVVNDDGEIDLTSLALEFFKSAKSRLEYSRLIPWSHLPFWSGKECDGLL